jgi:hypothetical protein
MISFVIPGRLEEPDPESILRSVDDYGFRARPPSPYGLRRAPRNDGGMK